MSFAWWTFALVSSGKRRRSSCQRVRPLVGASDPFEFAALGAHAHCAASSSPIGWFGWWRPQLYFFLSTSVLDFAKCTQSRDTTNNLFGCNITEHKHDCRSASLVIFKQPVFKHTHTNSRFRQNLIAEHTTNRKQEDEETTRPKQNQDSATQDWSYVAAYRDNLPTLVNCWANNRSSISSNLTIVDRTR